MYHASAAGLQCKYACSGRIVSIADRKLHVLFDNPMALSVLPKTVEHAPQKLAQQQADWAHKCGDAVWIAVHWVPIDNTMVSLRVHVCLLPTISVHPVSCHILPT